VVARDANDGPSRRGGRHPERVALALDDQHRHLDRVELVQSALLGPPGRMDGKGQAEHAGRPGRRRRAARDTGAGRTPTGHDRQLGQLLVAQLRDDGRSSVVELRCRGRRAPVRNTVGLLDERDREAGLLRGSRRGHEIRCAYSAPGAVTEDEGAARVLRQPQMCTRGAVECCDLANLGHGPHSLTHCELSSKRSDETFRTLAPPAYVAARGGCADRSDRAGGRAGA
jgi:hypothetical protein